MKFCVYDSDFPGLPWKRVKGLEWKVYVLVDPRDKTVRYVGISREPRKRKKDHIAPGAHNWAMARWKLELHDLGLEPLMAVVDSVADSDKFRRENAWMFYYVDRGCWLLNAAPNADWKLCDGRPVRDPQAARYRKMDPEQRRDRRIREGRLSVVDRCKAKGLPMVRWVDPATYKPTGSR